MPRLVLVHGVATTSRVWDQVVALLREQPGYDVATVDRPRTGDLARELAALAPQVEGAWVVGVSGGATLGLALASTGVPLAGAVLHEPAVGSLEPGLLGPIAAGFAEDGTAGLGRALYGASWELAMAGPTTDAVTAGELAMFRAFQPAPLSPAAGRVVVTTGALSPAIRHRAAAALVAAVGGEDLTIDGAAHFAPYDAPAAFAHAVTSIVS